MSEPLSILYVDDDDDVRTIVTLALSLDPAITLHAASSGPEALGLVRDGLVPDVAVLDVMMPDMNGPALMDRLHGREETRDLPVIFITAKARDADVALYRERGATGVIVKPFDPLVLATEVRRLLATRKA